MLLMPDHPTPLAIKTHTSDPVPYILYKSTECAEKPETSYTQENAKATGVVCEKGHNLMKKLLGK